MSEMTFRAKPFEFKARQWFKDGDHPAVQLAFGEDRFFVQTRQGMARVDPGDWIITLPDGESYPCKPDVFSAKYEPADAGKGQPSGDSGRLAAAISEIRSHIEDFRDTSKFIIASGYGGSVSVEAGTIRAILAAAERGPGEAAKLLGELLRRDPWGWHGQLGAKVCSHCGKIIQGDVAGGSHKPSCPWEQAWQLIHGPLVPKEAPR